MLGGLQIAEVSTCLKVTNFLRIVQFLVKLLFVWIIFLDFFNAQDMTSWQVGQIAFSIPFFAWYELYRLYNQFKKLKSYHVQYTNTIFDITAMAIVKTAYMDFHQLRLVKHDLADLYKEISYLYAGYLILPVVIYAVWLAAYCRAKSAASKTGMPLADMAVQFVTITTIAIEQVWYRILVYINVFLAVVIAAGVTWANINFFIEVGVRDDNIWIFLLFLFELLDIFFNLVEDRIACIEKRTNIVAFAIPEQSVPGFEMFNCPCCQPKPQMNIDSSSLLP